MKTNKNCIIKKNLLIKELHASGITRINPEALILFENQINSDIKRNINILSERIIIKGRRTLLKEDIGDKNEG